MNKKIFKKSIIIIFIILALSITTFTIGVNKGKKDKQITISSSIIKNRINSVKELVTTEYHYTNMANFENQNTFYGWKVPLTKKKFVISYEGLVKLGIDLDNVDVKINNNNIDISMNNSKIISHEIDENSLKVFDEQNSIFNPIKVEDYNSFSKDQKSKIEKDIVEKGILEESNEKSKKVLEELIKLDKSLKDYNINIKINSI